MAVMEGVLVGEVVVEVVQFGGDGCRCLVCYWCASCGFVVVVVVVVAVLGCYVWVVVQRQVVFRWCLMYCFMLCCSVYVSVVGMIIGIIGVGLVLCEMPVILWGMFVVVMLLMLLCCIVW